MTFQGIDEDSELIPLMTPEDEEEMHNEQLPETLPILPLRNTVLFPGVVVPITAGRDASADRPRAPSRLARGCGWPIVRSWIFARSWSSPWSR